MPTELRGGRPRLLLLHRGGVGGRKQRIDLARPARCRCGPRRALGEPRHGSLRPVGPLVHPGGGAGARGRAGERYCWVTNTLATRRRSSTTLTRAWGSVTLSHSGPGIRGRNGWVRHATSASSAGAPPASPRDRWPSARTPRRPSSSARSSRTSRTPPAVSPTCSAGRSPTSSASSWRGRRTTSRRASTCAARPWSPTIDAAARTMTAGGQVDPLGHAHRLHRVELPLPDVPGNDLEGLTFVKNIRRGIELNETLNDVKKAVVLEAGPLRRGDAHRARAPGHRDPPR